MNIKTLIAVLVGICVLIAGWIFFGKPAVVEAPTTSSTASSTGPVSLQDAIKSGQVTIKLSTTSAPTVSAGKAPSLAYQLKIDSSLSENAIKALNTQMVSVTSELQANSTAYSAWLRLGVLAKIATIFGESNIGISSVIQPEGHEGASVPLIFMLHYATNGAAKHAFAKIAKLPTVKGKPVMIRVESFE